MTQLSNRTPISILQETCAKLGLTPSFECISNEGQIHEPIYVYNCSVGNVSAIAKGCSKKKAKHHASYLVLLQLLGKNPVSLHEKNVLRDLHLSASTILGIDLESVANGLDSNISNSNSCDSRVNSVGDLQTFCQKCLWPSPVYEFTECLPGTTTNGYKYNCNVQLWKWKCGALGISKKEAKNKAASDFLKAILEQNLTIPPEVLEAMEEATLPLLDKKDVNTLKDKQTIHEKANRSARRLLTGIYSSRCRLPKLTILNLGDQNLDYCRVLDELLTSHKLSVSYSYTNATKSGKTYCQAQLSTIPRQVICSRPVDSVEQARRDAAYRCLVFLQSMTASVVHCDEKAWFRTPS